MTEMVNLLEVGLDTGKKKGKGNARENKKRENSGKKDFGKRQLDNCCHVNGHMVEG